MKNRKITKRFPVGLAVRLWSAALWRLALAGALVMLTWQCYNLRNLPGWTERQIEREGEATRAAALSAIGDTRKDVLVQVTSQMAALRTDVTSRVDFGLKVADTHLTAIDGNIASLSGSMNTQLARTGDSVVEVAGELGPVLKHVDRVAQQVDDAAPLFLNCDHNPDCLFNRYVGASQGVELATRNISLMSTEVRTSLPAALKTWQGIGHNVESSTARIDRMLKPHWYDRVLGYAVNGAILYRDLNPVTNLTLTGAQIISSRP